LVSGCIGAALASIVVAGCAVVSPPPVTAAHALSMPDAEGTTTVSLLVGLGGGLWIDSGHGVEVRLAHQLTEHNRIGVGVGLARASANLAERKRRAEKKEAHCRARRARRHRGREGAHPVLPFSLSGACDQVVYQHSPDLLVAVRLFGRFSPAPEDHRWLSFTYGAGFGATDTGIRYLTFDAGVRTATSTGDIDVYLNPVIAVSIPLRRGPLIDNKPVKTSWWFGPSLGVMANGGGRYVGSLDLTMLWGDAAIGFLTGAGHVREQQ
jgi:hypothetical protein